jgi:hypothetical protein
MTQQMYRYCPYARLTARHLSQRARQDNDFTQSLNKIIARRACWYYHLTKSPGIFFIL